MPIQNQQPLLVHLMTIDGVEITEHNRKASFSVTPGGAEIALLGGRFRRFYKQDDTSFRLSFAFLPNSSDWTVDGREGRDSLKLLIETPGLKQLTIQRKPGDIFEEFDVYINSYRETIVRRDIPNQCIYYNVDIELEEA